MNDEKPDTGFKLRPLIQEVLDTSEATEPDALALEVLQRIASYDRETALFQALKVMVRESWRPKFIPAPRAAAEPAPVVTPQNPPPGRDGRQWMDRDAADEAPHTVSWAEVRAQRPPDEAAVAEHRSALDALPTADDVRAKLESDPAFVAEQEAQRDEHERELAEPLEADGPDPAPGLAELRQQPKRYSNDNAGSLPDQAELDARGRAERTLAESYTARQATRQPTRRHSSTPPPPRPQSSPRVAAIREAWRRTLRQRIAVETGHKFFGDCTVLDLEYAAGQREQHAKRTQARADELRRLVEVMREHDVSTLKDLPVEVLAGLESSLETAAA